MAMAQSWSGNGKIDKYVIVNVTLMTLRYCDEVLDQCLMPYAGSIGPEFILIDNYARLHRAHVTNAYLERKTVVRMDWPARSPDLNPIDHAWDILQQAISARHVQPRSL